MAVNLSKKYEKAVQQKYTLGSLTKAAFGLSYDFIGAVTAVVYSLTSQALADYTRTGANRFGSPAELHHFVIASIGSQIAGLPFAIRIAAYDQYGKVFAN